MALMKGEGTHQILYGAADIFSGLRHNRGYLSRPDHSGSFPTVLLAHGQDGITASVKAFCRRLARYGLAVTCPDLYRGEQAEWPSDNRLASDLSDTFHWVTSSDTPWVQPGKIGVVGLDRGASAALSFAGSCELVGGVVLSSPVLDADVEPIAVPVLGLYGKDDEAGVEGGDAQAKLPQAEWVRYGGGGHGLIDESADDYRWEVSEDVADRTLAFFEQVLAE